MGDKRAIKGWLVEVRNAAAPHLDRHYLVAGLETAKDAEGAVKRYPGIAQDDIVEAHRPLSRSELDALGLMEQEVRRYSV
ncbi:MAG: hypothetical protein P4M07_19675 [Xanthobacteraceae bacterium]|nr:hypothetical protein [Xanthobacteraceae bacterium]